MVSRHVLRTGPAGRLCLSPSPSRGGLGWGWGIDLDEGRLPHTPEVSSGKRARRKYRLADPQSSPPPTPRGTRGPGFRDTCCAPDQRAGCACLPPLQGEGWGGDGVSTWTKGVFHIRLKSRRASAPDGNTGSPAPIQFAPTPVGNTKHGLNSRVASYGSSPRPWGTRRATRMAGPGMRFIPTPVGNTHDGPGGPGARPVHPHARGEHAASRFAA